MEEIKSNYIEQGWQCPICKAVMSPKERVCIVCTGNISEKITVIYNTNLDTNQKFIPNQNQILSSTNTITTSNLTSLLDSFDTEFNALMNKRNGVE